MAVAAIGTVFAAGYLLWMLQRVAFGTAKEEWSDTHIHDLHGPEWLAWTPLLIGILVFGIFPHLIFDLTDSAVNVIAAGVGGVAEAGVAAAGGGAHP